MTEIDKDDDYSYLDVKEEDKIPVPNGDAMVWAKIGDDLQLEYINWETINAFASQFDELAENQKEKTETHVLCKLITLVRDLSREEAMAKARVEYQEKLDEYEEKIARYEAKNG